MPPTKVTDEEAAKRKAICVECPHYRPISDRCGLCGCSGMLLHRIKSAFATCPEKRW